MKDLKHNSTSLLPQPQNFNAEVFVSQRKRQKYQIVYEFLTLVLAWGFVLWTVSRLTPRDTQNTRVEPFFWTANKPVGVCTGENGKGVSYSGHIGLKGDSEDTPKRSFYWLFEAQSGAENAPVILTFGGGPGTSGMVNPMIGQSHCMVTNGSTKPNPNAWSENYNLLALDHPIGAGFSYGSRVNNSRAAAYDVYDFLQKFYALYPQHAQSNLVIASGSYGGIYVPHIATVINEQNKGLARGEGQPGAIHINLESLMVSNPISDSLSYYRWILQQRCYNTNLYNSTACVDLFSILPACLEGIEFAFENPSAKNRKDATALCEPTQFGDTNGTAVENVKKKCPGSVLDCYPEFGWMSEFLNNPEVKDALGVPENLSFEPLGDEVNTDFRNEGDRVQRAHLMYEPLLKEGIRLLHYIGGLDCNCGWPGTLSFLKLLRTPFQDQFLSQPDIPWPSSDVATVRVVGEGAGNMTYILMAEAGHFVTADQPALVKNIVEHWIDNRPFV